MSFVIIGYFLFWLLCAIGAVVLFFFVLKQRMKEKKEEAIKHKDYKDY